MCGIFAFTGPAAPDPDLLALVAAGAAQRGPHGHGWAGHGVTPHYRLGPLSPADTAGIAGPRVLGHARLATTSSPADLTGLQPIRVDGHLVAHNGTITNPVDLWPGPGTDSVALAHAYAHARRAGLHPVAALDTVLARARHHAWAIVVLDANGLLVAHRHGLPLWRVTHPSGIYLSSCPLPIAAELAPDTTITEGVPWPFTGRRNSSPLTSTRQRYSALPT